MDKNIIRKAFAPVLGIFLTITVVLLLAKEALLNWGADQHVLLIGNTLIFATTLITFFMHVKALTKKTSMGFVNAVYGGMIIKMFTCLIAAFIYIVSVKKGVNKPALFGCLFFYLLYTFVETGVVTRLNRIKKNG